MAGFSLIEVLVALAILAVGLTAIFRGFSSGLQNLNVAEKMTLAHAVAESVLARSGIEYPLDAGTVSGTSGGGMEWVLETTPFVDDGNKPTSNGLSKVTVTVTWRDGKAPRSFVLNTLRQATDYSQ